MTNKIDVVDKDDKPTGKQSTIDNAMKHGLWHRGVHIMVCTKNGKVLVQKRSSTMLMHPGFLDISCGGFVDAGETPEQAAIRELQEELGIKLSKADLHFIAHWRKNHAWPKLRRHDRAQMYCYAVYLQDDSIDISHLQKSEVAQASFISFTQARTLIRRHHLRGLGRVEPLYGFYRSLLNTATKQM